MDQNIGQDDIGKTIEQKKIKPVDEHTEKKGSDKILIYFIIGIILAFGIFLGFKFLLAKPEINTIDDLHKLNLQGKLKEEQGYVYNGYSFVKSDGLWYSQVQVRNTMWDVPFRFSPKEVENLQIEGTVDGQFLNATELYMTFNPLDPQLQYVALAVGEMDQSLIKAFGVLPVAACDKNETKACKTRPIVTCEDKDKSVIYYRTNQTLRVIAQGNCIIIQGTGFDIVKGVDRVLMRMYGIMN